MGRVAGAAADLPGGVEGEIVAAHAIPRRPLGQAVGVEDGRTAGARAGEGHAGAGRVAPQVPPVAPGLRGHPRANAYPAKVAPTDSVTLSRE